MKIINPIDDECVCVCVCVCVCEIENNDFKNISGVKNFSREIGVKN